MHFSKTLSNMSNLNVSRESTVSDNSKTGFIFDIAPITLKNYIHFLVL